MSGADEWESLAGAWREAITDDPIFDTDVLPLLRRVLGHPAGEVLELGCGDGRVLRALGGGIGCDVSLELLRRASVESPVVRCRLPDLAWLRSESVDAAIAVLVLEHIADLGGLLAEARRVVRAGGVLAVVANHPAFTAAGSGPIVDLTDGEVLWRWGPYFDEGPAPVPIGSRSATVHHRTLGAILTEAAGAGWLLETLEERPLSGAAVRAIPGYAGQEQLPRLVAVRWIR